MGNKWNKYRLGDVATFAYGKLPKKELIGTGEFVIFTGYKYQESYPESNVSAGDLIVVARGVGGTGDVKLIERQAFLTNLAIKIDLNPSVIRKEYLFYLFLLNNLRYLDSGSAQSQITIADLSNVEFLAPDLKTQDHLIYHLQTLDKKITLNHQINQTLEQMAQTLFKSWFVDFDPVIDNAVDAGNDIPDTLQERAEQRRLLRAKADFKPLPAETRALFPSEFEETELGWVPKGWEPATIGKTFDVTMGQSPPGSTYNEDGIGMPFFQGKTDFGFRYPTNRVYCSEPKRFAEKDDTLISVRAPVGDANMAVEKCAIGRGVAAIRHKSSSASFTYYSIKNLSKQFDVFNGEGTVFGSINQKDMNEIKLLNIPELLIHQFDIHASTIDKKIEVTSSQIDALIKIRDSLLPKLISGELALDALPEMPELAEAL